MWIRNWAVRNGLSEAALTELMGFLINFDYIEADEETAGMSETAAQQRVQLAATRKGHRLLRNNNGACYDETGRLVRYGLGNISESIGKNLASSDLVGPVQYRVQPYDVGRNVALFGAVEMKKPGWTYSGTKREKAQLNFINLINSLGGFAQFATGPKDLLI